MLWKTVEWAGKQKCYIYPPLSQHSWVFPLFSEAIKLFSEPAFSLNQETHWQTNWPTSPGCHGGVPAQPRREKHTIFGAAGTHMGLHRHTSAYRCSYPLRGALPGPMKSFQWLSPLMESYGTAWEKTGRMFQQPPSQGGPQCPLPWASLPLNCCSLSREVRIFQECQGRMRRTSSVFSWFILLVPNLLSRSFFHLYLK